MRFNILYRGRLASCNYGCEYCPFAKRVDSRADLAVDRAALERFVGWVGDQSDDQFGVLFTPWGEALIRPWYQDALAKLTQLDHINRAVIQTNLSCSLAWISNCRLDRLALWTTFHPTEVGLETFILKVRHLHQLGVRLSVGMVGVREHLDLIHALRDALPRDVYLWVNAYKRVPDYYSAQESSELEAIDPWFAVNNQRHSSLGKYCQAGDTSFTVDGVGVMRRCHFVSAPLGNIYTDDWRSRLLRRACPNGTCSCHIGYVYLDSLRQDLVYGQNVLERIPLAWHNAPDRSPNQSVLLD